MVNQTKKLQVENLTELIEKNPNFILFKYEKTPHTSFEELRKLLKDNQSKIRIVKNTLLEKAINIASKTSKDLIELKKKVFPLKENSALITFSDDYLPGLNTFYQFGEKKGSLIFKFGVLDKTIYLKDDLIKIAKLPGKDQLLAKIIGSMKSPTTRLIYSLKFNINKLVYVLNQQSLKSMD